MKETLDARRLCWLVLVVLVAFAYFGGLEAPFVYDDKVEVIGNATIRVLDQWQAIATYNPSRLLLILSYALNYHFAGLDPLPYHVVNLAIHGLAVGAALALAEAVGRLARHPRPLGAALIGVGLWAVHPMGAQAVTYITGRSESLCALFCLSSMGLWASALLDERATGKLDLGARALALLAVAAALLSKEVGLVLPGALVALELLFPSRGPGASGSASLLERLRAVRWGSFLPLVVLVVAAVLSHMHGWTGGADAQGGAGGLLSLRFLPHEVDRPLGVQLLTQAEVWLRYVGLWLLPVGQTVFHVVPDAVPGSLRATAALAGWFTLVGVGAMWGWRNRLVGFALLCGALFLLPSSSVAPLKESMAEHRAYLLGLFLSLALSWGLSAPAGPRSRALARRDRRVVQLGVFLLGFLPLLTAARQGVWASEALLWKEATLRAPNSADAWYGLGDAQRFQGRFGPAMDAYRRATDLDPSNLDAWNNLGIARAELGDTDGAADAWRALLRRSPTYCKAHNNLGFLALRQREWDMAEVELSTTLAYCADNVLAHWGLGNIYYGPRRDPKKAQYHYQRVLDLDPDFDHAPEIRQRLLELTW